MTTTTQEDKEIEQLDPLTRCDYCEAVDLGVSHQEAIRLATNPELFEAFLNSIYK